MVVQNVIELPDGSAMKLTVARYYTPSGRSIQAQGIASATLYNTAFDVGTDSGDLDYIVLDNFTYLAAPVPEPQTYALMLAGLGFVRLVARRRKS